MLLPGVQKSRELGAALAARAMLRAGEGKFDDAWADLLACHRLGRLVGRGGTLIEGLVGVAVDQIAANADLAYLERANLTAERIRDRLQDLRALPPRSPMADKVDVGERSRVRSRLDPLDPALRKAVDDRAAADRTTASEVVREALRQFLKVR